MYRVVRLDVKNFAFPLRHLTDAACTHFYCRVGFADTSSI